MAESAAASILTSVIDAAVKDVVAVIKRQLNYLCCFSSNIRSLKEEAAKLDDATGGLQVRVNAANDNEEAIDPEVKTWLTKSKDIKDEMNSILNEVPNAQIGCLRLKARFSLSKKAMKAAETMKELRENRNFSNISHPKPPASTVAIPLGMTYEFESRRQIEENIMAALRDNEVNTIGICGMGGLGKTIMAKKVANRAKEEDLFDEIVVVVVCQQVDMLKIQVEIGGTLGLNLKEETWQARVQKLHARLSGTKRILLILDDVWERLLLEDLGIPCGDFKGCKVLLTSRNSDALSGTNVGKVFGLDILSKEEAWFLLRERAGTCVDGPNLNSIAKKVIKECKGLPIAIVTVGAALKDKRKPIWEDAFEQLEESNPIDMPSVIKEVYNPLKVSYDLLDSEHAKSVFLLCCLFREDTNISLEYLTFFCMGLRIFEDIRSLKKARNRMIALIESLKSRALLLDTWRKNSVRMHDVVRDVCIFLAKQKGYINGNDCLWISSFQLAGEGRLKSGLGFSLRLLFLTRNSTEEELKIENTFFEGMRDLNVLVIENYSLMTSLPHTTKSLKDLRTLVLVSCSKLETISVVGQLENVEILICNECYSVKELPPEIKGLNRLKFLHISGCIQLHIAPGIISSLVGLEELVMLRSFMKWEAEDREGQNAGLRELQSLNNLTCLKIDIEDPALAAENMHLSSKLEVFEIRMPGGYFRFPEDCSKNIGLHWEEETSLGHWIEMQLLRDTDCLILTGNGANNLDLAKMQHIQSLSLSQCKTIKSLVTASMDGDATVFHPLEHLELYCLPRLQVIWDGPILPNYNFQNLKELRFDCLPALKELWNSNTSLIQNNMYAVSPFVNLSYVTISNCFRLRNLRELSIAGKDCLPKLKSLCIGECEMMEQVFLWNGEDENRHHTKLFPSLEKVRLRNLPNLTTFYQGIQGIGFPLLRMMSIEKCPKMRNIISATCLNGIGCNQNNTGDTTNVDVDDDHSSHIFCQTEKVSFGSLKILVIERNPFCLHKTHVSSFNGLEELMIHEYHGSMCLFSSSIAENLVNLKVLTIAVCFEMVNVIENEKEEEKMVSGGRRNRLFPNLQGLTLESLEKLVSFCEWKSDVELPSLRRVDIVGCPNMRNFTLGSLTTPNLKIVTIHDEDVGVAQDLNGALQQHFARAMEHKEEEDEKEE